MFFVFIVWYDGFISEIFRITLLVLVRLYVSYENKDRLFMAIPFILLTSFMNLITTFSLFLFMLIKVEVISFVHVLEAHRN